MKKKILALVMAAVLVLSMAACTVNTSSTSTHTETVTDANGNTTTTTTTTTTENGQTETTTTVEETSADDAQTVADLTFDNDTGFDIAELYFTVAGDEDWGVNILEASGTGTLADTYYVTLEQAFTYSAGNVLWDMMIVDGDGEYCDFRDIDISVAADPQNITLTMIHNADDSYSVVVS